MSLERRIRIIAGTFILLSLALARWASPYWLLFTAFVGLNLIQSALTRWCLMEDILKAAGLAGPGHAKTGEGGRHAPPCCGG